MGFNDSRSIRIHYLEIITVDYAHYPVARGLGFGGYYGNALANQGVHQGGLSHIRITDYVYKTGFEHLTTITYLIASAKIMQI